MAWLIMLSATDILETVGKLADDIAPLLPEHLQSPARVVGLVVRDGMGNDTTLSVHALAAQQAASGAAASQASHLAGMREAIMRTVPRLTPGEASALLLEISRRTR